MPPPEGPQRGPPGGPWGVDLGSFLVDFLGLLWRFGKFFVRPLGISDLLVGRTLDFKNQHIVKWLGHSAGGWATAQVVESQYKWLGHSIDGWTIAQVVGSQYRLFHSLSHNKHHKRITKECAFRFPARSGLMVGGDPRGGPFGGFPGGPFP